MNTSRKTIIVLCLFVAVMSAGGASILILRLFFFNFLRLPENGMFPNIRAGSLLISKRRPYRSVTESNRVTL